MDSSQHKGMSNTSRSSLHVLTPPQEVITISSDTPTDVAQRIQEKIQSSRTAVDTWMQTDAAGATTRIDDQATTEREKTNMQESTCDAPSPYFFEDISVAFQVNRYSNGAVNELMIMSMIGEVNLGQDPYIVAAKYRITMPEMLQAFAKFASEKWEEARSKPQRAVFVATRTGEWEVIQDGKVCEDSEELLRGAGFVRART